jgi:mRNA interferase RelE/StbE
VAYTIGVAPAAQRELGSLARDVQVRIAAKIGDLAAEPRPQGVTKIKGTQNVYRVRVGDYRIVYMIDDAEQSVLITAVGHRSDIYRRGLGP